MASSLGLDRLGIDESTSDPPRGLIHRDRAGRLTGLLVETAWSRAHAMSLDVIDAPERLADLIEERARVLLSYGITAIHDTAMRPSAEAAYRLLAVRRRLPVSVRS